MSKQHLSFALSLFQYVYRLRYFFIRRELLVCPFINVRPCNPVITARCLGAASHGDVWFYVSSWGSGVATNQPSLRVGYDLRDDIPGKAIIGRKSWPLYGVGEEAYATDEDDPALVAAIKAGRELRIEATSSRNTRVAYHFSLSGSTAAIELAQSECR